MRRERRRRRRRGEEWGTQRWRSGRENEERSNCGRVLGWCNPHLLRGQHEGGRERDGSEILNIFFLNKYWHHQVYGGTVSFLSKECDEKILLHLSHNIYHSWRGMRIKKK
jgi:hypothetical protein